MPSTCQVCNANATTQCGKCRATWYCTRKHQVEDWKSHKSSCFPVIIDSNKLMGRHLVSSRDIEAGEIILKEKSLMIAPWQFTLPICLVCTNQVDGSYTCPKCNWPMCGATCQNSIEHIPECELTRTKGVNVKNFDVMHPLYEFIAPLRCLWIRDNAADKWKEILKLESHTKERKARGKEEKAKYMKTYLKLDSFEVSEVMHACGIIEVNTFEVPNCNKIALYEKSCLLTHSCNPNTYKSFNIIGEVVVRASVNIQRNQVIYTSYVDTVYGTLERQYLLNASKYFQCECTRCTDPTELGTNLSSILCRQCNRGSVSPPLTDKDEWICYSCGKIEDSEYIVDVLKSFGEKVPIATEKVTSCVKFLVHSKKYLSENHYLRLGVKVRLLTLYGLEEFNEGKMVSQDSIRLKLKLCEELLQLADAIMPGYNMFRGLLYSEMQNALIWDYQCQKLNKNKKKERRTIHSLKELQKILPALLMIYMEDSIVQEERDIVEKTNESMLLVENGLKELEM